jgi:enoyl-CoA hydratase
VAGGLELALACDMIIASDQATFADTHLQLGLIPSWGGAALLPLAVGLRRAKEMALTGRYASAVEAEHYGLVSEVVAPEALEARALLVAKRIAAAPTDKVSAVLQIHDEGSRVAHRMALERATLLRSTLDISRVVRPDGV